MKLFETAWRDGYQFFERTFDTNLNRSTTQEITVPYEWYEPHSKGLYQNILDPEIRLDKKQGRAKEGRNQHGFTDPLYRQIRDKYWKDSAYNKNPRIWWLDIETRSGRSFKNTSNSPQLLKVRKKQEKE